MRIANKLKCRLTIIKAYSINVRNRNCKLKLSRGLIFPPSFTIVKWWGRKHVTLIDLLTFCQQFNTWNRIIFGINRRVDLDTKLKRQKDIGCSFQIRKFQRLPETWYIVTDNKASTWISPWNSSMLLEHKPKPRQSIRQQTFGCSTPCFLGKPEVIVFPEFSRIWLVVELNKHGGCESCWKVAPFVSKLC